MNSIFCNDLPEITKHQTSKKLTKRRSLECNAYLRTVIFSARCYHSAVMRLHVVCLSAPPSVRDVEVCFSYGLEYFKNNFMAK